LYKIDDQTTASNAMLNSRQSGEDRRQYQVVVERIRTLIDADRVQSGWKLPAERELAVQFGVSRQSVREALFALELDGQVEIRGRSGVYVSKAYSVDAIGPTLSHTPTELIQARVVLERAVIALVASRITRNGLQRVGEALEAMRGDLACGLSAIDSDRQFHLSIAEMCGNEALVAVVASLFDSFHSAVPASSSRRIESPSAWQAALAEHEQIFRALEARDMVTADAALCSHLLAAHARIGKPVEPQLRALE
jgi:GntR family transcriptional regulator, transcriptional repressor for pyruvate dehydrogenase complex